MTYEFLIGKPPFEAESKEDTHSRIKQAVIAYPASIPVSAEAKDLISKVRCGCVNSLTVPQLLQRDPAKRISLDGVLEHPWIKRYVPAKPVIA